MIAKPSEASVHSGRELVSPLTFLLAAIVYLDSINSSHPGIS